MQQFVDENTTSADINCEMDTTVVALLICLSDSFVNTDFIPLMAWQGVFHERCKLTIFVLCHYGISCC